MKSLYRLAVAMLMVMTIMLFVGSHEAPTANAAAQKAFLLFGGHDHKTFLGCLNCSKYAESSVCNKYGKFGSKYEDSSIWNKYGTYGSKYDSDSPWNKYSSDAPIIVDPDGGSYGYFSSNPYISDRTKISWFVAILDFQTDNDDLDATRDRFCAD
jgi:hypothetical protein